MNVHTTSTSVPSSARLTTGLSRVVAALVVAALAVLGLAPAAASAQNSDQALATPLAGDVVTLAGGQVNPFAPAGPRASDAPLSVVVVPLWWPGMAEPDALRLDVAALRGTDTWEDMAPVTFAQSATEPVRLAGSPCVAPGQPDLEGTARAVTAALGKVTADIVIFAWMQADATCGPEASLSTQAASFDEAGGLIWMNGFTDDYDVSWVTWTHALGHALGFVHEDRIRCTNDAERRVADARDAADCTTVAQGHAVSVMGRSYHVGYPSLANMIAAQVPVDVQRVNPRKRTELTLEPRSLSTSGAVLQAAGRTYTIEYRDYYGLDGPLGEIGRTGVYITYVDPNRPGQTFTLDGDLRTADRGSRSRWDVPRYVSVELANGGHLTVRKFIKDAVQVVYSPPGADVPMPPKPTIGMTVSYGFGLSWQVTDATFECVAAVRKRGKWVSKKAELSAENDSCYLMWNTTRVKQPKLRIGVKNTSGVVWERYY